MLNCFEQNNLNGSTMAKDGINLNCIIKLDCQCLPKLMMGKDVVKDELGNDDYDVASGRWRYRKMMNLALDTTKSWTL